jgi:hypothetical protein
MLHSIEYKGKDTGGKWSKVYYQNPREDSLTGSKILTNSNLHSKQNTCYTSKTNKH